MATKGEQHVIAVDVFLNGTSPDAVRVERYAAHSDFGRASDKANSGPATKSTRRLNPFLRVGMRNPRQGYAP